MEQRLRRHLKPTNRLWMVDETYLRVKAAGTVSGDLFRRRHQSSLSSRCRTLVRALTDVGGNNVAARPDLLTQPGCHRAGPGPHFQASQSMVNSPVIRRFVIGSRYCSSRESLSLALSQELSSV